MASEQHPVKLIIDDAPVQPLLDPEEMASLISDEERAMAVLERLARNPHTYTVQMHTNLPDDTIHVIVWQRDGSESPHVTGPSVTAALLDLGAKLDAAARQEAGE